MTALEASIQSLEILSQKKAALFAYTLNMIERAASSGRSSIAIYGPYPPFFRGVHREYPTPCMIRSYRPKWWSRKEAYEIDGVTDRLRAMGYEVSLYIDAFHGFSLGVKW